MAMSGGTPKLVHTGYGDGKSSNPIKVYVYYKSTQNNSANKSTVYVGMYVETPTKYYDIGPWDDFYGSYVGQKSITFDGSISNFAGTKWLVEDKHFDVNHNTDGSASATIYWKWGVNSPWGKVEIPSGNFEITLPKIPRQTTPQIKDPDSLSIVTSCYMGSSVRLYVDHKASSDYTHSFSYDFGTLTGQTTGIGTTTGVKSWTTFTPPLDLAKQITTNTSGTCTIHCITYDKNGTQVGSTTDINLTLKVPSSCKPSIGSFTHSVDNGWQTKYMQNMSKTKLTISSCGTSYNSSISQYYIYQGNDCIYSKSSIPNNFLTTDVFKESGKYTFYAQVKDARGRYSDKVSLTIDVLPYAYPSISIIANRIINSTTVRITYTINYSIADGRNAPVWLDCYYKEKESNGSWALQSKPLTLDNPSGIYSGTWDITNCEGIKSYSFYMDVQDRVGNTVDSNTVSVGTDFRLININSAGNGIGFGQMSLRTNTLEISDEWDTYINGSLTLGGHDSAVGSIIYGGDNPGDTYINLGGSWTELNYIDLPAGIWILTGGVVGNALSTSSVAGALQVAISTVNNATKGTDVGNNSGTGKVVSSLYGSKVFPTTNITTIANYSSDTKLYLLAAQSSDYTVEVQGRIKAVRIA